MTATDPSTWEQWAAARPATEVLHLDSAAVGRPSTATLEAVAAHARLEAEIGGYVAEDRAEEALGVLRSDVAALLGSDPEGVVFTESATSALEALVRAWPWPERARVAVAAAEWGPSLEILEDHGVTVTALPVDAVGVVDLDALATTLRDDPPDVLLVDQVAAHRGLVQPAASIVALGREQGVPVWIDAAQSVGNVRVPRGADAVFATSRKWLTGPRGVGMLAVGEAHRSRLRVRASAKRPGCSPLVRLESEEAHVAGRVGLGVAVREHLAVGPEVVEQRLAEVGAMVREMARTLSGWEVAHPAAPASATTSLRPTAGQDVAEVREVLLRRHGILTSVCFGWRAPRELAPGDGLLRLSPHVDVTVVDLETVAGALPNR